MANVKRISIRGILPFNCTDHAEMNKYLGQLNGPSLGLRITYGVQFRMLNKDMPNYNPNEAPPDGETTMYHFEINGEEAIHTGYLENVMQAVLDCGGSITATSCRDIENNEALVLKVPKERRKNRWVVSIPVVSENAGNDMAGMLILDTFRGYLEHGIAASAEKIARDLGKLTFQPKKASIVKS